MFTLVLLSLLPSPLIKQIFFKELPILNMIASADGGVGKSKVPQTDEAEGGNLDDQNIDRSLDNNEGISYPEVYNPVNEHVDVMENGNDEFYGKKLGFWGRFRKAYPNIGLTVLSILSWYFFSLSISLYNKWMFSKNNLDFAYPIIITSFHQAILFGLSLLTLRIFPRFRLNYDLKSPSGKANGNEQLQTNNSAQGEADETYQLQTEEESGRQKINNDVDLEEDAKPGKNRKLCYIPPIAEYLTKILPCSLASAGDIGFGNVAFRFITLSLYTMVKTSSLVFVLLWGVAFKLEKMTCKILTIVIIMVSGVCMMVWGQQDDSSNSKKVLRIVVKRFLEVFERESSENGKKYVILGVGLVLLASCMSGLRWALTQIMLKRSRRTRNPVLTMLYLSPAMSLVLFIIGSAVEGFGNFVNCHVWKDKGFFMTCILILIPGLLAYFMTLSEYILLQCATLLTLSITGIFKELLTIFASGLVFGDKLNTINIIGLVVTFTDIVCYNVYRFQQNTEAQKTEDPSLKARMRATSHEFVDIELSSIIIDDDDDDNEDEHSVNNGENHQRIES